MHDVKEYILKWIEEFVSVNNSELNNWPPCPYARQAVIDNKISWCEFDSNLLNNLCSLEWNNNYDLCIIHTPNVTSNYLSEQVKLANSFLMPKDIVCLEDHPEDIEEINGVVMNNGKYPIVFMQKLSNIQMFSESLKLKGYYDVWSEQNLEDVVNWRQ